MNIREAFQEELRQMTQVAACARYRRGRQRRGCSLPSDELSAEQIRLRCGPVRVFRGGVEITDAETDGGEMVCAATERTAVKTVAEPTLDRAAEPMPDRAAAEPAMEPADGGEEAGA